LARNGSGTYERAVSDYVANTVIDENDVNQEMDDIGAALTGSIAADGQTTTTNAIPFAQGIETDTVAEKTAAAGVTIDGVLLKDGSVSLGAAGAVVFEGATPDAFETTLTVVDPTADRTITLPDASFTITAAGAALIDDADAAAQRTTLGLGTAAVEAASAFQAADADIPTVAASQVEMEAGTETELRSMSPARVKQAIDALANSITAGTPLVISPFAVNASYTQAHGLGAVPSFLDYEFECLTAEGNYSIGDRVKANQWLGSSTSGNIWTVVDATNISAKVVNATFSGVNKTTFSQLNITNSSWKLTVTPYLVG
jgi:hypothetical protein